MSDWQNILSRFATWFSAAIDLGDQALAERFARIAFGIEEAAPGPPCALHDLLDYLEQGELENLETRREITDPARLRRLAKFYEGLVEEHRRMDCDHEGSCEESAPRYQPRPCPMLDGGSTGMTHTWGGTLA